MTRETRLAKAVRKLLELYAATRRCDRCVGPEDRYDTCHEKAHKAILDELASALNIKDARPN